MKFMLNPLEVKGRAWARLSRRYKKELLARAFEHWRRRGFPYYSLTADEIGREYKSLCNQSLPRKIGSSALSGSAVGLRLANNFHPQMWSVRVSRYLSPMDVFMNDGLLVEALERSWVLWPDRYGARASSLRRILKSFPGTASVSNFRPTVARAVIASYTKPGATVVDFASGYGGRMLGCITLARDYIGIEPCSEQIEGLVKMLDSLKQLRLAHGQSTIYKGCAEDILPTLPSRFASLIFSSPPYYDWEKYSIQSTQSFLRHRTYEAWLSGFLTPIICEANRVLKRKGHLILNISGKRRFPSRADVEKIAAECGFAPVTSVTLLLARIPYLHPRRSGAYKPELLLVFQKS